MSIGPSHPSSLPRGSPTDEEGSSALSLSHFPGLSPFFFIIPTSDLRIPNSEFRLQTPSQLLTFCPGWPCAVSRTPTPAHLDTAELGARFITKSQPFTNIPFLSSYHGINISGSGFGSAELIEGQPRHLISRLKTAPTSLVPAFSI